jgi:hypothetical protein
MVLEDQLVAAMDQLIDKSEMEFALDRTCDADLALDRGTPGDLGSIMRPYAHRRAWPGADATNTVRNGGW